MARELIDYERRVRWPAEVRRLRRYALPPAFRRRSLRELIRYRLLPPPPRRLPWPQVVGLAGAGLWPPGPRQARVSACTRRGRQEFLKRLRKGRGNAALQRRRQRHYRYRRWLRLQSRPWFAYQFDRHLAQGGGSPGRANRRRNPTRLQIFQRLRNRRIRRVLELNEQVLNEAQAVAASRGRYLPGNAGRNDPDQFLDPSGALEFTLLQDQLLAAGDEAGAMAALQRHLLRRPDGVLDEFRSQGYMQIRPLQRMMDRPIVLPAAEPESEPDSEAESGPPQPASPERPERPQAAAVHRLRRRMAHLMSTAGSHSDFNVLSGGDVWSESRGVALELLQISPHLTSELMERWLYLLRHTTGDVWISNPYFLPPRFIVDELIAQAQNGRTVTLMTCGRSDVPGSWLAAQRLYWQMIAMGGPNMRIYVNRRRIMHGKSMVLGGNISFLGSFNWDYLSIFRNSETLAVVYDEQLARSLIRQYHSDMRSAYRMPPFVPSLPHRALYWLSGIAWGIYTGVLDIIGDL